MRPCSVRLVENGDSHWRWSDIQLKATRRLFDGYAKFGELARKAAPADTTQIASFYDRHVPAQFLPIRAVRRGEQRIAVSRDPRQRVCQQCHAPNVARTRHL